MPVVPVCFAPLLLLLSSVLQLLGQQVTQIGKLRMLTGSAGEGVAVDLPSRVAAAVLAAAEQAAAMGITVSKPSSLPLDVREMMMGGRRGGPPRSDRNFGPRGGSFRGQRGGGDWGDRRGSGGGGRGGGGGYRRDDYGSNGSRGRGGGGWSDREDGWGSRGNGGRGGGSSGGGGGGGGYYGGGRGGSGGGGRGGGGGGRGGGGGGRGIW